jgi:hypothetical protein
MKSAIGKIGNCQKLKIELLLRLNAVAFEQPRRFLAILAILAIVNL